jgi:hypothetical protein
MRVKHGWIFSGAIVLLGFILALGAIWSIQKMWADELRPSIQKYLDVSRTIAGWQDTEAMAQVASGNHLRDMVGNRCLTCTRVQVAIKNHIERLEVLQYSQTVATVRVRSEWGWHDVNPETGMVIGPCHAQAATNIFILTREEGTWKVSDFGKIEAADVNPVDDTPELRAKYCSAN